ITGFNAKGLAMLGTDEVVTSYQTHFHEVAHLLINYKLKLLGLYTLPFFMEGFAVAVGGRGGMAPRVVTDLGYYLQKTAELTYDSIFTFDQFRSIDGSMSYPVSGLYNSFLLSELGGEKYLELYKSVNGIADFVKNLNDVSISLPEGNEFEKFMTKYQNEKIILVDGNNRSEPKFRMQGSNGYFVLTGEYIKFLSKNVYSIGFDEIKIDKEYKSRKYAEYYKEDYRDMKYCILASEESISLYNLFNDELIFSYNKALSFNSVNIPQKDGFFEFFIKSSVFNNDFNSDKIILDGTFR
ncbi:MAG: hypothetical protein ABI543_12070, partial [Ignavibacteria bacterium]